MKTIYPKLLTFLAAFGVTLAGSSTIIVNQTNWLDGGSDIQKTNQVYPYTMGWQCGTAANYGGENGQLHYTNNTGSTTYWAYFADSNSPVALAVGEKIRLTANLTFTGVAVSNGNRHLRFAMLYSGLLQQPITNSGTIRNDYLTGYGQNMNFGVSWGVNGPLQAFADTNLFDGQAVISKSAELDANLADNGGGTFGDPGFSDGTNYTLIMTVAHTGSNTVDFTTTWLGSTLLNGGITQTITDTNYAYTNYDTFVMRPNASATACATITFSSFKVEKLPSVPPAPQFTSITRQAGSVVLTWNCTPGYSYNILTSSSANVPPANWTLLQAGYPLGGALGSSLTFTNPIAASGNLFYRLSSP